MLAWIEWAPGAVVAPPWADPKLNPCANEPRGWQLLYWPPDGKCYKIFQLGHPCPDDMELSPAATTAGAIQKLSAECKCPPKTAQSARDGRCYELFTSGPCEKGHYFGPDEYSTNSTVRRQWGICKQSKKCGKTNEVFWPKDGKCYDKLTRGPCPRGQLLTVGSSDKLAVCKCNDKYELGDYNYGGGKGCFQHFTKGPCTERGHLFLPDKTCGCSEQLPHYHNTTKMCFEIGSIGPCDIGEHFQLDATGNRGLCVCKKNNIRYKGDSKCYRPYTQGPCEAGDILVNATSCISNPCNKSHLFFPESQRCYRIGTRGPCGADRVVTFDFETRPSVDGISYNGVCGCERDTGCFVKSENECGDREPDRVLFRKKCYKLYTQGPCSRGAWILPKRAKKVDEIWTEKKSRDGYCDCMPGYTKIIRTKNERLIAECLSPTVRLAEYLTRNFVN